MMKTFNKSLLAIAVAATSFGASAADITVGSGIAQPTEPVLVSNEGAVADITVDHIVVKFEAEYKEDDLLTFTFGAGALDTSSAEASLTATLADGNDSMTLGLVSSSATSLVYRITDLTVDGAGGDTTIGGSVDIGGATGLDFDGPTVFGNGSLSVSYSAVLAGSGLPLDSTGSKLSETIVFTADEFVASVASGDELDAVINVEAQRLNFVTPGADVVQFSTATVGSIDTDGDGDVDANDLSITDNANLVQVTYKVESDFSWVVDTDTATTGIQAAAGTFSVGGTCANPVAPVVTATDVTFKCDAGAADTTLSIDPRQGGSVFPAALTPKTYTTDVTYNYTNAAGTAASKTISAVSSGSWTLNGSQVRVPYMVVGNGRFGIIANVTNHGSQTGDIVVDVFDEAGNTVATNYAAGTSTPGSIVSVAPALNAALAAGGIDTSATTTKFSFQITTNVPENDIFVYAAYTDNTTSERAIVNTDAKVQVKGANVD